MSVAAPKPFIGFYLAFYWVGVAMTLGCLGLALASNTPMFWRFEHTAIPLSWQLGGVAVVAFLAAEFGCGAVSDLPASEAENSQLSAEWESVET